LLGLSQDLDELRGDLFVALRKERVRDALGSGSTRSADAMHVVLCGVRATRHVIIDDATDIFHVQSSCSHVGSNQHAQLPGFEGLHDPRSFPLGTISMQTIDGKAIVPQSVCQVMTRHLLGDKDNHFGVLLPTTGDRWWGSAISVAVTILFLLLLLFDQIRQDLFELVQLFVFPTHDDRLFDIFVGNQSIDFSNIDLDRIFQKVVCQCLDLTRPRRRKQQGLSFRRNMSYDGANLWLLQ
jgi:hypothetical protein